MFLSFVKDFSRLITPFSSKIRKAALWVVVTQIAALIEPFMVMLVINAIVDGQAKSQAELAPLCAVMLVALVLIGLGSITKNRHIRNVWLSIEHDLPLLTGKKLLDLPYVFHQTENTGMLVGKMVRGVYKTGEIVGIFLFEVFPLLIQTVVTSAMLAYFSPYAAAVLVPVFAAFVFMTASVKLKWADHRMKRHKQDSAADEILGQAVMNVMTTQAFVQEHREIERVRMVRDRILDMAAVEFHAYDRSDFLRNALVSLGRVGVVYACALAAFDGSLSLGLLVFAVTLAERVFINCYRIGTIFDRAMEAVDSVREINAILAEADTVPDPAEPLPLPSRLAGGIEFRDVRYSYRNRRDGKEYHAAKLALDRINMVLPAGKMIAIVGESGSGKSTLGKLLMRCDDPTEGAILFDGVDLRRYAKRAFRRQIGYVLQDVQIYDLTVAQNIAYGQPDATRDEIVAAAKIANAHEFILALEHGYDTKVGDRGFRLSGGERQRVGIARAWLLDPPIMILDEATSSVDVVSEAKIQKAMDRLKDGRTLIVIAHRLSTIHAADIIVVMNDGRVQEVGSHEELLRENGIYHNLVDTQRNVEAVA